MKLLEEKKLEEAILKVSAKPPLLQPDLVERILCPVKHDESIIEEDRVSLDVIETGLLFYMERIIRELGSISKVCLP